jgi:hypothetical protein
MPAATPGPGSDTRRILVIKPSSLGDIVHALPVLAALRAAHPRAHIAWLVSTSFGAVLEGHPLLDEIIPFDRRGYGRMLRGGSASPMPANWRRSSTRSACAARPRCSTPSIGICTWRAP